jgi:hypothetical protein
VCWRTGWISSAYVDQVVPQTTHPQDLIVVHLKKQQPRAGGTAREVGGERSFPAGRRDDITALTPACGLTMPLLSRYLLSWTSAAVAALGCTHPLQPAGSQIGQVRVEDWEVHVVAAGQQVMTH